MLKFSIFVLSKWWRYLLLGLTLLILIFSFFIIFGRFFGLVYLNTLIITFTAFVLLLLVGGFIYVRKSDNKTQVKRALWYLLYNLPLGLTGLGLVFFTLSLDVSPALNGYEKQLAKLCHQGAGMIDSGETYDSSKSKTLENFSILESKVAEARLETCPACGMYDLYSQISAKDESPYFIRYELYGGANDTADATCFLFDELKSVNFYSEKSDAEVFQGLCDKDYGPACESVGENDRASRVEKIKYFTKSCDLGHQSGCENLLEVFDKDENGKTIRWTKEMMNADWAKEIKSIYISTCSRIENQAYECRLVQ